MIKCYLQAKTVKNITKQRSTNMYILMITGDGLFTGGSVFID